MTSLASAQKLLTEHAEKMLRRSLRRALEDAGFEPDNNVCGACGHAGGSHDLGNWCLVCPRPEWDMTAKSPTGAKVDAGWCYFASMTHDEKWEYGIDRYLRALQEAA